MTRTTQIVDAVNRARRDILNSELSGDTEGMLRCLETHIWPYKDDGHVAMLMDILAAGSTDSTRLRDLTHSNNPEFILGFFDIPYNREAYLEAASVRVVSIPEEILEAYPTGKTLPVTIDQCTDGFLPPTSVAVFGENYVAAPVQDQHRAYYFVDKFVDRFNRFCRPVIEGMWSPTSFRDLLDADEETLFCASATWVHLHEHFHRKGFLPIPKFIYEKSTRNAGGAEELRVDLLAINELLKSKTQSRMVRVAHQFILAERLIRYPLQAEPSDNYDARSSVALFAYLYRKGVIAERGGRYFFDGPADRLGRALLSLAVKITSLEYRLSTNPEIDRRKALSMILTSIRKCDAKWVSPEMYTNARSLLCMNLNRS